MKSIGSGGSTLFTLFVSAIAYGYIHFYVDPPLNVDVREQSTPVAGEITELILWDQEEEPNSNKVLVRWINEFNKENPEYSINHQTYPPEELQQKFTTAASAGKSAHMVWAQNDLAGVFHTAQLIQPVDSLMDSTLFSLIILESVHLDGHFMGAPLTFGNHLMLLYNKKFIPNAPKTMEDLISLGQKFTNKKQNHFGLAFNINDPFWLIPFVGGFGGNVLAGNPPVINLDTPAMVKALQLIYSLKFQYGIVPNECDYECGKILFLEEKSPMLINGDWFIKEAAKKFKSNLGIAPLPRIGSSDLFIAPPISGKFLFVNKKIPSHVLEGIKRWISFMHRKKTQIEMATLMGRIPASREAQVNSEVLNVPLMKELIETTKHALPLKPFIDMSAIWSAMGTMQHRVMSGKLSPQEAARLMQKSAVEKLASYDK